nr:MAG TPA: Sigma factor AlgU negative regulatory factor, TRANSCRIPTION.96A [Caudoviricetes sp.]
MLAVDVHGQSCLQTAERLHVSVDGLAKIRRRAYAKIADDMQG